MSTGNTIKSWYFRAVVSTDIRQSYSGQFREVNDVWIEQKVQCRIKLNNDPAMPCMYLRNFDEDLILVKKPSTNNTIL